MFTLNYSTLRALPYTSGSEFVFVQGYSSIGDGGEGIFFWDSSLTGVTDNDGTIILYNGTSSTGVWKRVYSGPVNVKWFGISGTDNTAAIQKAVSATGKSILYFPAGNYAISATIILPDSITVTGDGMNSSIITSSVTDFAFYYQAPAGLGTYEAPKFFKLQIHGYSGIKINDVTKGFSDGSDSQQGYVMRPYIEEVNISGTNNTTTANGGIGIQWSKCFDGVINKCSVQNFDTGIDFQGSDLCTISNNRIFSPLVAAINLISHTTFGSQTLVSHNDILSARGGSYIISSDLDPKIEYNLFERIPTGPTMNSVLKFLPPSYQVCITDNRVDVESGIAPYWLDFSNITVSCLVTIRNNFTRGPGMGSLFLNAGGYPYWYNPLIKAVFIYSGNSREDGVPFNSQKQLPLSSNCVYLATPSTDGLTNNNYGLTLKCINNEFILPPIAAYGSSITFRPGVTGLMNIYICCYADTAGQVLNYQRLNGTTVITQSTVALTTTPTIYQLYSNVSVSALALTFWNNDLTNNSSIRIQKVYVDQAI